MAYWTPQPGPQAAAAICPANHTFFGGTRGGGKSDGLLGRHLAGAEKYGRAWNGIIIRKKYKDFAELRRRIDELIHKGLPAERIGGDNQPNRITFSNGAKFVMVAIKEIAQASDFLGHQYTEVSFDEATSSHIILDLIDQFRATLRSPHGVPCRMFSTGNPGGPGHNAIKHMFIEPCPEGSKVLYDEAGESRIFIKSTLADNKILVVNDPDYVKRLMAIKNEALRRAWLLGDWDVFVGQMFNFLPAYHICKPFSIPQAAMMYMTMDWGFGAPFSLGWWWVDSEGTIYRCYEWYGWNGRPNQGLRLTDSAIAEGIKAREKKWKLENRNIIRLAGPDCFNKKPDFKGGGQGPSTAEVFAQHGLYLSPGDPSRELKIRQFHERLRLVTDPDGKVTRKPRLQIYENCRHFIRTIPTLSHDDHDPEDIDTDQEDHVYDEACHIMMARPIAMPVEPDPKSSYDKRLEELYKGGQSASEDFADYMASQQVQTMRELGLTEDFGEMTEYDDGELYSTVE